MAAAVYYFGLDGVIQEIVALVFLYHGVGGVSVVCDVALFVIYKVSVGR